MVLKDDLDKVTESHVQHNRCRSDFGCTSSWWVIRDGIIFENLVCNSIVLGQFQWGGRVDVRDAIDSITNLAVNLAGGVHKLNSAGNVNGTVMVGALRVRPGSTGSKIPAEGSELVKGPSPTYRGLRDLR